MPIDTGTGEDSLLGKMGAELAGTGRAITQASDFDGETSNLLTHERGEGVKATAYLIV
jgi:hypothetical protein